MSILAIGSLHELSGDGNKSNKQINMVGWWVATVIMVIAELGLQITVYILYYVGIASLYKKHLFNLYIVFIFK